MDNNISTFINLDKNTLMNKLVEFQNACKENRVFPNCDYIHAFEFFMNNLAIKLPKDFVMYRARIFTDDTLDKVINILTQINLAKNENDFENVKQQQKIFEEEYKSRINNGFFGYDEKNSFINPKPSTIKAGRCNHEFEACLYTSEDPNTAISELKPLIKEKISVAKISAQEELNLIDLTFSFNSDDNNFKNLLALLFLTSPTETEKDAYLFTQVICSLVKKHGYDGIKYSSCQNMLACNYAIFHYDKCKAVSSDIYTVNGITYSCKNETNNKTQKKI